MASRDRGRTKSNYYLVSVIGTFSIACRNLGNVLKDKMFPETQKGL